MHSISYAQKSNTLCTYQSCNWIQWLIFYSIEKSAMNINSKHIFWVNLYLTFITDIVSIFLCHKWTFLCPLDGMRYDETFLANSLRIPWASGSESPLLFIKYLLGIISSSTLTHFLYCASLFFTKNRLLTKSCCLSSHQPTPHYTLL